MNTKKRRNTFLLKNFLVISLLIIGCNKNGNNLENTIWKNCGGIGPDILVFSKKYLLLKKDTIYFSKNDSAIAIFDRIENYYGERRLFIKNLANNSTGRYCEQ